MTPEQKDALRRLPQLGVLLDRDDVAALVDQHGRAKVKRCLEGLIAETRAGILQGSIDTVLPEALIDEAATAMTAPEGTLRRVINATGVIVHTNLGRAPLARSALRAAEQLSTGYASLEYDLEQGARGSRHHHAASLLCDLTGAEAAVVVNNCAAAVHVCLAALAAGREVVVSRGELVEIGGGFRVPDVMAQSGAILREVGTTNRTHPRDYASATTDNTALLMKVHRSNFDVVGFVAEVGAADLVAVGRDKGVPVMIDAGAGALIRLPGCPEEVPIGTLIEQGVDLVCFSGDKLLGGPQAGLIVGRRALVGEIRTHPMMRAMRPDKLTLSVLVETLRLWRDKPAEVPLYRMLNTGLASLRKRAQGIVAGLGDNDGLTAATRDSRARVGGGSTPNTTIDSVAVVLSGPSAQKTAAALRSNHPPVIGRIVDDEVWLDMRTIAPDDDETVMQALQRLGAGS